MCKEKLKFKKMIHHGASSNDEDKCDEKSYFVDARKIRISLKDGAKKEVIVHIACLKQLELIKQRKQNYQ